VTVEQRYLEDFKVGERFASAGRTLSDAHFVLFGELTGDAHPIHYDAQYARSHGWSGPLAHGLLLLAMTAFGSAPEAQAIRQAVVAMTGTRARFRRPAVVGDTVYPEFEVSRIEPKGPDRGLLYLTCRLVNQRGELLVEGEHALLLRRRTSTSLRGTS
jgi:acyl dehydratase